MFQCVPSIVVFNHFYGRMAGGIDDADKVFLVVQGKLDESLPERMGSYFFVRNN